jgi:hypothetical protein
MQVEKEEIQFWLAVNDEGACAVSFEGAGDAITSLVEEYGGAAVRTVELTVSMALPTAVEVERLEVTDEDADAGNVETAIGEVEEATA